jgi:RHS repeat-associated protein
MNTSNTEQRELELRPYPLPTPSSTYTYLQSIDYTYNVRNWLTGINDVNSCATQAGDSQADAFSLRLTYQTPDFSETAQFNGNIASMQWRAPLNSVCRDIQGYNFTYDAANRLRSATFWERSTGTPTVNNRYSEPLINYDLNGNITQYQRNGLTTGSTYTQIDNLTYTYDANNPNRLSSVNDATTAANRAFGFVQSSTTAVSYTYDNAGNLITDSQKQMTLAYNALNLPDVFTFTSINPNNRIEIGYDAGGMKLEKQVFTGLTLSLHKRYVGGIEYTGANLEGIYHAEGRLTPNGANFRYEYTLKDHLGNSRVSFAANGTSIQVLQENHYYPFGMEMRGSWVAQSGTENAYQYTGKELNEDFSLNWSDYGARWYDASLGRWNGVDQVAEKFSNWSPYNYVYNNPLNTIDPDGNSGVVISITESTDKNGVKSFTITIRSHFYVYGSGATPDRANKFAAQIEKLWNEASGEREVEGVNYKVKFQVTAQYVKESDAKVFANKNKIDRDFAVNFARIEEGYTGLAQTSPASRRGGNSMILSPAQLDNLTTAAHEYGHSLGLTHELDWTEITGQPGIMATVFNVVELPYTINPNAGEKPKIIGEGTTKRVDNELNVSKRLVLATDVARIVRNGMSVDRKMQFGDINNRLYTPTGKYVE